jgi:hypothetical protein
MIDLIKPWIAFIKPWEEVKNTKGSIVEGIIYAEIGVLASAILSMILFAVLPPVYYKSLGKPLTSWDIVYGSLMVSILLSFLLIPILLLIGSAFYYLIAKLFGGKGSFELQTFRFGYFSYPLRILVSILIRFGYFSYPLTTFTFTYEIGVLIAFWALLIYFFIIKETHKVSNLKAIAIVLIPVAVAIILGIIIMISITSTVTMPLR